MDKYDALSNKDFFAVVRALQVMEFPDMDMGAKRELCDRTGLDPAIVQLALDRDAYQYGIDAMGPPESEGFCRAC